MFIFLPLCGIGKPLTLQEAQFNYHWHDPCDKQQLYSSEIQCSMELNRSVI